MLRKVAASIAPPSGALLVGGMPMVDCAADGGDRSSRDAITIPTAMDATAMSIT
jgi:hypothetical protein